MGRVRSGFFGFGVALFAASAQAQHTPSEASTPSAEGAPVTAPSTEPAEEGRASDVACPGLELRLEGASAGYGEADTSFREEWRPALTAARLCLERPEHARSCLEVQGQYDERTFERAVTHALGSERAAQVHRARARAEAVLSELHEMGLGAERLRHRPPPIRATFRGASVSLVPDCIPAPRPAELPAWIDSPEALASTLAGRGLLHDPAPPTPPSPTPPPPSPPPPPPSPRSPVWIEVGLALGATLGEPENFLLGGPHAGVGVAWQRAYVRGVLAFSVGQTPEQRTGIEYVLAGGYRALPWLDVGVLGGHRIASRAVLEPWLSQAWRIGVESSQRVLSLGDWGLWLTEAVAPLGERLVRAVVVNGRVFDVENQRDYALRLDFAVSLRGHVF